MSIDLNVRMNVATLLGDYVHSIDDAQYEAWPDFFADDCAYRITTRENFEARMPMGVLSCNSKGMLHDRINSLRKANIYEPHRYRHLLGPTRLQVGEEGVLHARTGFTLVRIMESGATDLFLTGLYDDKIVAVDGELKFRERIVILDSSRVDTLIVLPV